MLSKNLLLVGLLSISTQLIAIEKEIGGASGYDSSIEALEPTQSAMSISLAGESPADISRFILADNQGAMSAKVSPDGTLIGFIWSITGARQLWITEYSGGQPKQLTFGNGISFFRWSPNGKSLVYGADNNGNEQEAYYRISIDGLQETELLPSASGGFRQFGAFIDDNHIAYASTERNQLDFDIYTANTETKKSTLIHKGQFGFFVSSASPNGRYLTIRETVGEDSDNLYLYDLNTQSIQAISTPQRRANHSNAGIAWLPDSSGFYLASNVDRNFAALMHYSLQKGWHEIHTAQWDVERVALCGESGQFLVWLENHGGYSALYAKNLSTNKPLPIPNFPEGRFFLHCNRTSNIIAVNVDGWQAPGDIFSWDLATGKVLHTFESNLAGLNANDLVRPQSITLPARDGVNLHGLLYLPKNTEGENKPPVLFQVHGGPTGQSRPTFSASSQYLAGKGIAVFLPNVRGSTGFGHEYVTLDDRENRLDSVRDLIDMLNYLGKQGLVDANRAAVAGGSYGGYAVNAVLANYPGHFKAGVSAFGVADWVTALQVASPALKASDRIEYGDITEQKWLDFYTAQSPIRQADKINVPVLYSHGVMDPRIDIYETEVMVKTLRSNGIDAPFIRIPDEGHGWRKLSNKLFYYRQKAEFLEQHLGVSTE